MSRYFTPLRYPGGKAKLAWFVKALFKENRLCDGHYVEPYAGGAGIGIELLLRGYVSAIHLNDLNFPVYAFWYSVLNCTEELCRRISKARLTVTTWQRQKEILAAHHEHDVIDVGFAFFYLNRTNRSGIISGGVIGGYEQTGQWKIDARFTKAPLIERVQKIAEFSSQVAIYNLDALELLQKLNGRIPKRSFVYLDPPYYRQGQRLYDNFYDPGDHASIAKRVAKLTYPWMVSYDDVEAVRNLYSKFRQTKHYLQYSAATAYRGTEILIFSDNLKLPRQIEGELLSFCA